jgi:hypothetical protein
LTPTAGLADESRLDVAPPLGNALGTALETAVMASRTSLSERRHSVRCTGPLDVARAGLQGHRLKLGAPRLEPIAAHPVADGRHAAAKPLSDRAQRQILVDQLLEDPSLDAASRSETA